MKNKDFLESMSNKFAEAIKKQMIESFDNLSDDQKFILMQSIVESNDISEIAEGEILVKIKEMLHEAEGKPDIIKKIFEDVPEDAKLLFMLCSFALEDSDEE